MAQSLPSDPDTDAATLRRALAGDAAAFGTVMRAHYEPVFRLVYAVVRNRHDAQDICQEVWLAVWNQRAGFRNDSKFSTWLHPIAVRRAIDHLRKRRRWFDRFLPFATGAEASEGVPEPVAADDARQQSESTERLALLHRTLDTLPPKLRAVLALREVQGLSYEEIARVAGVPTGTVMSRLYHARRLLARKLSAHP